ncbi:MAG: VWA domain-containing protein [Vampirovibrio sp.]|nr:VWA domain-containing protein [Vampirovibrio sp.]
MTNQIIPTFRGNLSSVTKKLISFLVFTALFGVLFIQPGLAQQAQHYRQNWQAQFPQMSNANQPPTQQGGVRQHSGLAKIKEPENVLIILDASYSMIQPLDSGQTKMNVAKRSILHFLQNVPPHVNVGLRVYGHSDNRFTACRATQLMVPLGVNNRHMIANNLLRLKPTGSTPISLSLKTAINQDFMNIPGKKSIILVSDGIETCDEDPCGVAVNMVRQNVGVKINVIGFGLEEMDAARNQLKCIALSTYGKYYTADSGNELERRLNDALDVETRVEGKILIKPPSSGN